MDFSAVRRRRPRSAHFDPGTITLPPQPVSTATVSFKTHALAQVVPEAKVDDLYTRLEKLGEGSYAVVYKCERKYVLLP